MPMTLGKSVGVSIPIFVMLSNDKAVAQATAKALKNDCMYSFTLG